MDKTQLSFQRNNLNLMKESIQNGSSELCDRCADSTHRPDVVDGRRPLCQGSTPDTRPQRGTRSRVPNRPSFSI